jgi:hypothetical protein
MNKGLALYGLDFQEEENNRQRDPKRAVCRKGAEAEIVSGVEFQEAGYELRGSSKSQGHAKDDPRITQPKIVKLKQKRGRTETCKSYYRRITQRLSCCHCKTS